jgi:hypothetical protein
MSKRPTAKNFRERALQNREVKAEYDALAPAFEIERQTRAMRKAAGLKPAR